MAQVNPLELASTEGNPRFVLRAYEDHSAVRTAFLMVETMARLAAQTVSRDEIVEAWAAHYPRHADDTGRRSIRNRVSRGLGMLKIVGAVTVDGDLVTVGPSPEALRMSARNLQCIEDANGEALPPSEWPQRPRVPDYLSNVQQALIDSQAEPPA